MSPKSCANLASRLLPVVTGAALLLAALIAPAAAKTAHVTTGLLPSGNGEDLEIHGQTVYVDSSGSPYNYNNINIYSGGTLCFVDDGKPIEFWAANILVENGGTLTNGIDKDGMRCVEGSFGTNGGTLTIHLYGPEQGVGTGNHDGGVGITCKADSKNHCGIPDDVWNSNMGGMDHLNPPDPCNTTKLPGNVSDCFYQYGALDFDDGLDSNKNMGYVGYKVLGVTYGGKLRLYGKKGSSPLAALQKGDCTPGKPCPWYANSGRSWGRLAGTVKPTATTLVIDRLVYWQPGDQIVLTTTDYIPGHSEQLTIKTVTQNTSASTTTLELTSGVVFDHNGETYGLDNLPAGTGPDPDGNVKCTTGQSRCIDTRAAIGLLTRNIRIVSGCDSFGQEFPAPGKDCAGGDKANSYYFGGQVIVRQGVDTFQMTAVELKNMGEGGRIMHYPIHFHMDRTVPLNTYVVDSSIWDSMNRWITIHATGNVQIGRNVGYLSIGHGFYLEDGTETGNDFYSNLGVLVRGAIQNVQNPRKVPGILSHGHHDNAADEVPYNTDSDHPTVFWIMNGWNNFSYNMAAGANSCGVCYWLLPSTNSGHSRYQHWYYYSAEQEYRVRTDDKGKHYDDLSFAGMTPLASFLGNSCVAAQNSFLTIGNTAACTGVTEYDPDTAAIPSPYAPAYPLDGGAIDDYAAADMYYPKVAGGGSRAATVCSVGAEGKTCETGKLGPLRPCDWYADANGGAKADADCTLTRIDRYTTSFNWADTNLSAIWLRRQWYLFVNSAVTDVQNGGLTFVSGGGYTYSDEVPGYWALARKSVFIGNSQKVVSNGYPDNPFASNAGPFNPKTHDLGDIGIQCNAPVPFLCISAKDGIFFTVTNFAMNQRLFNIYDGPAYEEYNAFLDVTKTTLEGCDVDNSNTQSCRKDHYWGNGSAIGVPADSTEKGGSQCYLPNAAIAWKQPNGFYYPPAFRSNHLYFSNVDIRHFVIEPLFNPNTLNTDTGKVSERYCNYLPDFNNFYGETANDTFADYTDVDRQTELTDEDGSLTGLRGPSLGNNKNKPTISVNKDPFFRVPIETAECSSDLFTNMPAEPLGGGCKFSDDLLCGTANTSPYEYLTTAMFPQTIGDNTTEWSRDCADQHCAGVPLYRLDKVAGDGVDAALIRMSGQHTGQRSTLTVNNGGYYLDTTLSDKTQEHFACKNVGGDKCDQKADKSVFQAGQEYYVFMLYANPGVDGHAATVQDYNVYVGDNFNKDDMGQLFAIRVNQGFNPPQIISRSQLPTGWTTSYSNSVLTVHVDMSSGVLKNFGSEYTKAKANHCGPAAALPKGTNFNRNYCQWDDSKKCYCAIASDDPECDNACTNWAGKDINCPEGGCYGFGVKLPGDFQANDQGKQSIPAVKCAPKDDRWNTPFVTDFDNPNPTECDYKGKTIPDNFCTSHRVQPGKTISQLQ